MTPELWSLVGTAFAIGFIHTVLGPDHYLPFIAMSKAGGWTRRKTLRVTALCGIGHVGSSVLLGLLGIALGLAVHLLEGIEATRGSLTAWLLIGFGLAYLSWGVVHAMRGQGHDHLHRHADGTVHSHPHGHFGDHLHVHTEESGARAGQLTPWMLFVIFVLGPCEPLIPLLMYPAAEASWIGVALVTAAFAVATLATMLATVAVLQSGWSLVPGAGLGRYQHILAGAIVLTCGLAVKFGL